MKRILRGILIGGLLILVLAVPVLAAYYAYITVTESNGNSYEELPIVVSRNITQLAQYDLMSSTGLDTRVLTGDGAVLPHMLADNKVLFTSDLAAYETKTLVFYLGATSLSSFPIIVGYNGSFETPDDPDLELGYVMELLIDGYFNAEASDVGHNILYKEDAFRVWISDEDEIKVAAYNSTGGEQWEMHYSSFATGEHTVYVLVNGLAAYLYVDDFDVAKDTQNLFETNTIQISAGTGQCFYASDLWWVFYGYNSTHLAYITSADAVTWSSPATVAWYSSPLTVGYWDATLVGNSMDICYSANFPDNSEMIAYRRGQLNGDSSITWSTDWQVARGALDPWPGYYYEDVYIAVSSDGYPFIAHEYHQNYFWKAGITKSSANNGTWETAGGYPFQLDSGTVTTLTSMDLVSFPDGDKMFVVWRYDDTVPPIQRHEAKGRYYNGTSWGSDIALTSYVFPSPQMVVDDNGYLYVSSMQSDTCQLSVRHPDGVWEGPISYGTRPLYTYSGGRLCYSSTRDCLYLMWIQDVGGTKYLMCRTLNTETFEFNQAVMVTPLLGYYFIGTPLYGEHIGFTMTSGSNVYHAYIDLSEYIWNDNANDWYWMQDDVTPYIDDIQLAVDGILQLEYKPAAIILGTVLPDEENDHDGIITWGTNPAGVTATVGAFQSDVEVGGNQTVAPGMLPPQDMIGPTGNPGNTRDVGTLTGNPFYPLVKALSDNTSIPVQLWWIILASLIVLIAMVVTYKYLPHQMIVALVGGGLSAFFYGMGIYPFWVVLIFAVMGLAIILGERSPTV